MDGSTALAGIMSMVAKLSEAQKSDLAHALSEASPTEVATP